MPRDARAKGEFCTYHIIQRGNERRNIFREAEDKQKYLTILSKMKEKYNYLLYAYCLMDNHIHILLNTNGSDISQIMKSIGISYAIYFNRKYKRSGHLFQDRFKSELVENERYLLELSRYIHLNPVRANIVVNAVDYQWSSYPIYLDLKQDINNLVEIREVLKMFSEDISKASKEYIEYVSRGLKVVQGDGNVGTKDALWTQEVTSENKILEEDELYEYIKNIATENNLVTEDLTRKRTLYIELRNEAIRQIRRMSNISLKDIGRIFGGLSESAISKIING